MEMTPTPRNILGKPKSVKALLDLFSWDIVTPPKPGLSILCFLLLLPSNTEEKKKSKEQYIKILVP